MISIYNGIHDKEGATITIEKAMERIQRGKSKATIEQVRKGNKDAKSKLPAVTWSGKFSGRGASNLVEHSGFLVLDFDHVGSEYKDELKKDPFIYAAWVSPSGDGVKALVQISDPDKHEEHFYSLQKRFNNLDKSGKDVSRLCFESHDPDIYINKSAKVYTQTSKLVDTTAILSKAVNRVKYAAEGSRNDTLLRSAAWIGTFIGAGVIDEVEAERELLDAALYSGLGEQESKTAIHNGFSYGKMNPVEDPVFMEPDSVLSQSKNESEWLKLVYSGNIPQGLPIGSDRFDTHFRLKKKTMVGIFGIDNVGKTTFWTFLMVAYAKMHGVKWLIFAKENNESAVRQKIIEISAGMPLKEIRDRHTHEQFAYDHFSIVRNDVDIDKDNLTSVIDNVRKDEEYIFIDPYNAFQYDSNPKSNYAFLDELRKYQNKNGVSFFISMHISTEKARNWVYGKNDFITDFQGMDVGVEGQMKIPRKNFVEGGQPIANKLDDILIIHRLPKNETLRSYTLVSVDKVKEEQTGGMVSFESPILFKKMGKFDTFVDEKGLNPVTQKKEFRVIEQGSYEHKSFTKMSAFEDEEADLPF